MDNQDDLKLAQEAKVAALESVIQLLTPGDRDFAKDLTKCWNHKGFLSERQWPWIDKLLNRATGVAPKAQVLEVGDFSGVLKLFKTAQVHLKYPKITLMVENQPLALSVAGAGSKAPGTVNVTDGRPFGQNVWFGRVTPQGVWEKSQSASEKELAAVGAFLQKFGKDPSGVAKEYGRLTGRCCFCNGGLTDERSTAAGFGPVCAKHFGLESEWKTAASKAQQHSLI